MWNTYTPSGTLRVWNCHWYSRLRLQSNLPGKWFTSQEKIPVNFVDENRDVPAETRPFLHQNFLEKKMLGLCVHSPWVRVERLKTKTDPSDTNPNSYWRQQASRKSVTGESSAKIGRPPNQRLFKSFTAFSASSSRRNWRFKKDAITVENQDLKNVRPRKLVMNCKNWHGSVEYRLQKWRQKKSWRH